MPLVVLVAMDVLVFVGVVMHSPVFYFETRPSAACRLSTVV